MRVLITGASGFLGFNLCRRLVADGHETTALHREGSRTERLESLGVRRLQVELSDLDMLRRAVAQQNLVIHAAADIRSWPTRPDLQDQVNVNGTRNVALACRLEGVERMIHVSSVSAIGISDDPRRPASEDFAFNLQGPGFHYHLSKRRAEQALLEQVNQGLDAVIVNPGSIFGPHGPGYRGGEMIRKVQGRRIVPCFTGGRCAVHVDDVIGGILAALSHGISGERYILGGDNVSYREIASRSDLALQTRCRLVTIPPWMLAVAMMAARAAGSSLVVHCCDDRFQYYSSDKARRVLGYTARGFDSILAECLAWAQR